MNDEEARRIALMLLAARAPESTICPSEVARALFAASDISGGLESWRSAMPIVHAVVDRLLIEGHIQLSWKGSTLESRAGPYSIARSKSGKTS